MIRTSQFEKVFKCLKVSWLPKFTRIYSHYHLMAFSQFRGDIIYGGIIKMINRHTMLLQ